MSDTSPVPQSSPPMCPSLSVRDARAAMEWYREVFDATEVLRLTAPDGTVIHGELRIGGCLLMLGEESREPESLAPPTVGGTPVRVHLYVPDVDAVADRAVAAGAEVLIPIADQFYSDRSGRIRDPFGHEWILASRRQEMSPEQMQRKVNEMFAEQ